MSDELYYCGFNGFRQVPSQPDNQTLTSLISQSRPGNGRTIHDLAICWNYLVVAEPQGLVKYGLVDGKPGQCRLSLPPGAKKVKQVSATPRHILAVTDAGECWAHEESKGWRLVNVGAESPIGDSHDDVTNIIIKRSSIAEEGEESAKQQDEKQSATSDSSTPNNENEQKKDDEKESSNMTSSVPLTPPPKQPMTSQLNGEQAVRLCKTSCGDAHNIGLDTEGRAYSLPSPLDFSPPYPGQGQGHKVTDVVCGKEHCLLLTEHGQVFSWGVGSRGQLGHGNLLSEDKPRLVMALDGMRIRKVAAGGWHSACISQYDDLYMFGWNESGQLAQPTNLAKPAECFSAVEKLFMACCTMQPEDDAAIPRGDDGDPDAEVYHKNNEDGISTMTETSVSSSTFCGVNVGKKRGSLTGGLAQLPSLFSSSISSSSTAAAAAATAAAAAGADRAAAAGSGGAKSGTSGSASTQQSATAGSGATATSVSGYDPADLSFEKDVTCTTTGCNGDTTDLVTVQSLPMLVSLPASSASASGGKNSSSAAGSSSEARALDVDCGSRHTVVLTKGGELWAFGWNKYGQLGIGHNHSRDAPEKMSLPRSLTSSSSSSGTRSIKSLRCGDWGTAIVTSPVTRLYREEIKP